VRVAIRKLPGVESVDVSLERAITDVRLKPGNTLTLGQLRQIIKSNGFNAKEATVTAVGSLTQRDGEPAVTVSIINAVWLIVPGSGSRLVYEDAARRGESRESQAVEVTGVVQEPRDSGAREQITLHTLIIPSSRP
jgi:copper chaperone CopZ